MNRGLVAKALTTLLAAAARQAQAAGPGPRPARCR